MGFLEDKGRARLFYKYLSRIYDRINPYVWTESMRDHAIDRFDVRDGDRVLDVGCGTGFATEALIEETDDVYGLDQSPHQLEKALAKLGGDDRVEFHLGDAERLPYETDSFDAVWSSGSIEYWPEPVQTLREMRRVCKPGGTVLVVGPNEPESRIGRALADAIMLFYGESEADRMFEAAGYEDIEHWTDGPSHKPDVAVLSMATVPE